MSESVTGWRTDPRWPDVDVVMPVRDEAAHLDAAIASVRAQDYSGRMQILLGVAPSGDGTEAVADRLAAESPDVTVVANPAGTTPSGLNAAIEGGVSPVVVRVDGHSRLTPDYVQRAVETLRRTGAANVGGSQVPETSTPYEAAVAAATTSWMGTGGPAYRTGGQEGPVDTVYLGVFDREAIESVGLFDETLIRNQDYELNVRLRSAGHLVWFDPELRVRYRPRGSWSGLVRQYFDYGRWKAVVLRRHPSSARLRQLVPPAAVATLAVSAVLAPRNRLARLPLAVYGLAVAAEAVRSARRLGARPATVAGALTSIHVSWSVGLVRGAASCGTDGRPRPPR